MPQEYHLIDAVSDIGQVIVLIECETAQTLNIEMENIRRVANAPLKMVEYDQRNHC